MNNYNNNMYRSNTGTTNYTPRFNKIGVTFRPAAAGAGTQDQVGLTLADTVLYTEAGGTPFTALDPTSSGTGTRAGFPALPQAFNGLVFNKEGNRFYVTSVSTGAVGFHEGRSAPRAAVGLLF
mgnify:CR=1 FL=1